MAKRYRLASTQCSFIWGPKRKYNPYDERFEPESVPEKIERNIALQMRLFEEAGRKGADLVVGAEDMQRLGRYGKYLRDPSIFRKLLETIPGPTSRRVAKVAKKHRMYIVACYYEKVGRRCYNTAVLFSRHGRILGKYRKVQLAAGETWFASPGSRFPVFKTELGNIGIATCYDMWFPEVVRCLALEGADIICHPTMGYGWNDDIGECAIKSRCVDNGVHIIVSCSKRSQVVSPWAEILCDAGYQQNVVVFADVDSSRGQVQADDNYETLLAGGIGDVRERIAKERHPAAFAVLSAKRPPLMKRYSRKPMPSTPAQIRKAYEIYEEEQTRLTKGLAPRYQF